jgi:hypothetical protein
MPVVNYRPEVGIERIPFLKERSGNVIENKGALWKAKEQAGMSMKTKAVSSAWRNITENKGA